jgi:lipoprotein-anchoring transpeptidase ErfK/SrfK
MAALTLVLLAGTAPTAILSAQDTRGFYFGAEPWVARPAERPRAVRRHTRTLESRVDRKQKTASTDSKLVIPPGPLQIVVSISKQRVTLFADGQPVTSSNVSTGTPGHPTPMGVFTVIEKDRHHFSNLYDAAPMPYMQRITWSGSALHEGPLPGRPASHGCVRLTGSFAQMLWKVTKIGVRVIVTKDEVAPVEIELPDLFARPRTVETPVAPSAPLKATEAPALRAALADRTNVETPAAPPEAALVRTADATGKVPLAVSEPPADVPASTPVANATAPEQATKIDLIDKVERAAAELTAASREAVAPADGKTGAPASAAPETGSATAQAPAPSTESKASVVPAPAAPHHTIAPTLVSPDTAASAIPVPTTGKSAAEVPAVLLPPSPPLPRSRREAMKSGQPISVFVSRKQGKLYVRQKWTPLFEMPVTIANPDQPLGTHVFTAMEAKGDATRWTVISIPSGFRHTRHKIEQTHRSSHQKPYHDVAPEIELPAPGAREALARITFPPEAVTRIADLLKPGSSLIISDNRLSDETGDSTDFIVLTP